MTFNELFAQFQKQYGNSHDIVFFELVFHLSRLVTNKERFVQYHTVIIDFKKKKFDKLCKQYFVKERPLAHIVGHTTFCGLQFEVSKKVLAPRDVTEQMVKDFITAHSKESYAKVYDLCCGCGCIGISIKKYIPQFDVTCIDKYWGPIFDTNRNGIKHKTALVLDCVDAIKYLNQLKSVDYLISNPPYINFDNFKNVKMFKWENKKALIAEENGLYFYKRFFAWLDTHQFKEAWFEIGYDLADALKKEASLYQNLTVEFSKDKQYIIVKRNN